MASVIRGDDDFDSGEVIGQGQTWQNMTASRSQNTTYTNTSGKPIMVMTYVYNAGQGTIATFYINGVIVQSGYKGAASVSTEFYIIVPSGATYSLNTIYTLVSWSELR